LKSRTFILSGLAITSFPELKLKAGSAPVVYDADPIMRTEFEGIADPREEEAARSWRVALSNDLHESFRMESLGRGRGRGSCQLLHDPRKALLTIAWVHQ
jgi:hypothetical protein